MAPGAGEHPRPPHREDKLVSGNDDVSSPVRHARMFPARLRALSEMTAFTAEACGGAGLGRDACLRLTLLLEELFTNTVVHGHAGGSDELVAITFDVEPGRISLTYEDAAPPHDPFAAMVPPDDTTTVEDRLVGGLGVLLVASMATDVEYRRADGRNRIALTIRSPR
jgi:serine/threonine-protein kinase RsbW